MKLNNFTECKIKYDLAEITEIWGVKSFNTLLKAPTSDYFKTRPWNRGNIFGVVYFTKWRLKVAKCHWSGTRACSGSIIFLRASKDILGRDLFKWSTSLAGKNGLSRLFLCRTSFHGCISRARLKYRFVKGTHFVLCKAYLLSKDAKHKRAL